MDAKRFLGYEFLICVSITSLGAIRKGFAPWPPTIIYSGVAVLVLAGVSLINEKIAMLLGAGFLIALIVKTVQPEGNIPNTFAALPPPGFDVLSLGGTNAGTAGTGNAGASPKA